MKSCVRILFIHDINFVFIRIDIWVIETAFMLIYKQSKASILGRFFFNNSNILEILSVRVFKNSLRNMYGIVHEF